MVVFRVFVAVAWCVCVFLLITEWWFDEYLTWPSVLLIASSLAGSTFMVLGKVIDAFELERLRRNRHLDRRPQI